MKLSNRAHQVRNKENCDAWWYENKNSIEIYCCSRHENKTVSFRIDRSVLQEWLKRVHKTDNESA